MIERSKSSDEQAKSFKIQGENKEGELLSQKHLELVGQAIATLASEFHEDWREARLLDDGSFEPRPKTTTDTEWVSARGTDQVDIANTAYEDLPADWQAENKAAATVVVDIMMQQTDEAIDLNDLDQRNKFGEQIHRAWLDRNKWAAGGELDVPFEQLSPDEQAKDIAQLEVAQRIFGS